MSLLEEIEVQCPFCGEMIFIDIDRSVDNQAYVEDCSVCCRPISFQVECEEGEVLRVDAGRSS